MQKAAYFLRALGYPAAQKFDFNIYLNGPYSPDLTEVYYLLEDDGLASSVPAKDIPKTALEWFREADSKGIGFLEALTTVMDATKSHGSAGVGLDWATAIKPHIPDETWQEVRSFLHGHPQLIGST